MGIKNSHTIFTAGSYTLSKIMQLALSQRLPLHTVNYSQLRYRYGTGTNTYCRATPYLTLKYIRYTCLLKGHPLAGSTVLREKTMQSLCSPYPTPKFAREAANKLIDNIAKAVLA